MAKSAKWFELNGTTPFLAAAQAMLRERMGDVTRCLQWAAGAGHRDPESVHQLRVATRRAAAALRVVRPGLRKKDHRGLRRTLRRLRAAAAEARDLDVHRTLVAECPLPTSIWQRQLDVLWQRRRTRAQTDLRKTAKRWGPRWERRCNRALERLATRSPAGSQPLRRSAARVLRGELTAMAARAKGGFEDSQTLHRLRIACKRLRYALELFAGCYGPELRRVFYPRIEAFQTLLGAVHDWQVLADRIAAASRQLERGLESPRRHQLAEWTSALMAHCKATAELHHQRFLVAWKRWTDGGYAARLAMLFQKRRRTRAS